MAKRACGTARWVAPIFICRFRPTKPAVVREISASRKSSAATAGWLDSARKKAAEHRIPIFMFVLRHHCHPGRRSRPVQTGRRRAGTKPAPAADRGNSLEAHFPANAQGSGPQRRDLLDLPKQEGRTECKTIPDAVEEVRYAQTEALGATFHARASADFEPVPLVLRKNT